MNMKVISYFSHLIIWTAVLWEPSLASSDIAPIPVDIDINGQFLITITPHEISSNPQPLFQVLPECGTIFTEYNPNRGHRSVTEYKFFHHLLMFISNYFSSSNEIRNAFVQKADKLRSEAQETSDGIVNWTIILDFDKYMNYNNVLDFACGICHWLTWSNFDFDWKRILCLARTVLHRLESRCNDAKHRIVIKKWRLIVSRLESGKRSLRQSECYTDKIVPRDEL